MAQEAGRIGRTSQHSIGVASALSRSVRAGTVLPGAGACQTAALGDGFRGGAGKERGLEGGLVGWRGGLPPREVSGNFLRAGILDTGPAASRAFQILMRSCFYLQQVTYFSVE